MVVEKCKRIPYECECIHIPQHITEENSSTIRADIRRFLPQVVSLEFCYDYSFDVVFINKYGCKLISHIEKGSYIVKKSDTDWSVYSEQMFEKMYNLKGTTDNIATDSHMRIIIEGKLSELKDSLYKDVDPEKCKPWGPNLREIHNGKSFDITIKNVKIYQDQLTAESTPFVKLEKGDLACMVDFHMNDESSINIQDRSDNVISW